jgi:hypothetical protein
LELAIEIVKLEFERDRAVELDRPDFVRLVLAVVVDLSQDLENLANSKWDQLRHFAAEFARLELNFDFASWDWVAYFVAAPNWTAVVDWASFAVASVMDCNWDLIDRSLEAWDLVVAKCAVA